MSELKCIYWENATPDDFINARRGETWIQGVEEAMMEEPKKLRKNNATNF